MTVTLLLLASLVAGCQLLGEAPGSGTGPGGNAGSGPNEPIGAGPGSQPGDGGGPGDGARREEPNPDLVEPRPAAVDHFRLGPDGRTVVVYWWGGTPACFGLREVTVEVRQARPVIGVVEGILPEAVGKACTMEAVLKSAVVSLDVPLLTDGSGNQHPQAEPVLPPGPMRVEPREGLGRLHAVAVVGYRLSPDGRELDVHYVGGTDRCYGLGEASVQPTERGPLAVTLREGVLPDADGACEDIGVAKVVGLRLEAPLVEAIAPPG